MLTLAAVLLSTSTAQPVPVDLIEPGPPQYQTRQVQIAQLGKTTRFVTRPGKDALPWAYGFSLPLTGEVKKGNTILITASLRSPDAVRAGFNLELAREPHSKYLSDIAIPGKTWKTHRFAGIADQDYASGGSQLSVFLGYGPGTFEIADLKIQDLGKVPIASLSIQRDWYGGQPNPESWRKAAEQRIEKHRKGDLVVKVVGSDGKPIPNAQVAVEQVRHAFRFGTAVPAARIVRPSPDQAPYQRNLRRLFNTVVFENDLKWQTLGERDYRDVDKALDWLKEHQFDVRGHTFVWGSQRNLPRGLWEKSDGEIRKILEHRVKETATRFKGRLYAWDVVNEAVTEKELWERLGWDMFVQVHKWAREADPTVQLVYNDFNITEETAAGSGHKETVKQRVKHLLDNGAPLDVIGIQAHVGVPMTPTKRVLEILDEMSQFKKPLEITEYDLGVQDDKVHAQHMADFLTACFSHPNVQSFLMWGFWEGAHWRAREGGAMFRLDWTERPAVKAYEDLVKRKWWTRAQLKTDRSGQTRTRAFRGTHQVTVSANGRTAAQVVTVGPNTSNVTIRL